MVENYAVVERLRVHFHSGLNLLTGETGSGKSIVVDALGLLLGGRASADMIRTGEIARARGGHLRRARPCGHPPPAGARGPRNRRRRAADRARDPGGRQVARLRRQPAGFGGPAATWRRYLADIHGQHDQQLLFSRRAQREMLDAFAGASRPAGTRRGASTASGAPPPPNWRNWSAPSRRSCACSTCGRSSARKSKAPRSQPDEDAALENERRVLQNVQRLQEAAGDRLRRRLRQPRIGALAHPHGRQARWTSCAASIPRSNACASN